MGQVLLWMLMQDPQGHKSGKADLGQTCVGFMGYSLSAFSKKRIKTAAGILLP